MILALLLFHVWGGFSHATVLLPLRMDIDISACFNES